MGNGRDDVDLRALVERLDRLEADNAELRASNAELRAAAGLDASGSTPSGTEPARTTRGPAAEHPAEPVASGPVGRRQMLRTGLVVGAAAAAGAVLSDATPAAAADGGALIMGVSTNTSTNGTSYVVTGAGQRGLSIADNAGFAATNAALQLDVDADQGHFATGLHIRSEAKNSIKVISSSVDSTNKAIDVDASIAGTGIYSLGADAGVDGTGNTAGVRGRSSTGVALQALTTNGLGLLVNAGGANGADVFADTYQLRLVPFSGRGAPIADSSAHNTGELVRDSNADLWLCVGTGVPGDWRKLGGPATAGQLHVLPTPARVYDSRPFTTPNVGLKKPLAANENRSVDLKANSSGVPAGARAVMVNLLLVNLAAGSGNFTVWANGTAKPLANTMVFANSAASNRASTLAVTSVDAAALCQLNSSHKTDVVVDVVGYYR
jgi:hypothetical protein